MREPFDGTRATLNAFFNVEIFLGVAILTVTTFYLLRINSFLSSREQKILLGQLLHFHVLSLVIILVSVANLQLWKRLWELQFVNTHTTMFLNLWLSFITLILLCGLGTLWCLSQCIAEMVTTAETALHLGIDKYYEMPEWKLRWDELQINQECCGVDSYIDWQNAIWLQCKNPFRSNLKALVPYSCCRKDNVDCYKVHAPDAEGIMPTLPIKVINTDGCIRVFKCYLNRLSYMLWALLLIALFVQICIWLLVGFIFKNQSSGLLQDFSSHDFGNQQFSENFCVCENCKITFPDAEV